MHISEFHFIGDNDAVVELFFSIEQFQCTHCSRPPHSGLRLAQGDLRVTICGILGMVDAVAPTTGKSAAIAVGNLFEPILDAAHKGEVEQ